MGKIEKSRDELVEDLLIQLKFLSKSAKINYTEVLTMSDYDYFYFCQKNI